MIESIPQETYRARAGYSSSTVAAAYRDPRIALARSTGDSEAMMRGRIVHAMTLEPHERPRYVVAPACNLATTAGKAQWADWLAAYGVTEYVNREGAAAALAALGYDLITQDALDALREVADRIRSDHRIRAGGLLTGGIGEGSAFADVDTGTVVVRAKCRPDYYTEATRTLIQLKTGAARGLSPDRWLWTMRDRAYDVAEAWCASVLALAGHPVDRVVWICAATDAPLVWVYEAAVDSGMLATAWECALRGAEALDRYEASPMAYAAAMDVVTDIGGWNVREKEV